MDADPVGLVASLRRQNAELTPALNRAWAGGGQTLDLNSGILSGFGTVSTHLCNDGFVSVPPASPSCTLPAIPRQPSPVELDVRGMDAAARGLAAHD